MLSKAGHTTVPVALEPGIRFSRFYQLRTDCLPAGVHGRTDTWPSGLSRGDHHLD